MLACCAHNDSTLAGKKVLVVDDDVRNIFALTSVLEQHNLQVVHAENGRAGIECCCKHARRGCVLMDIMMPEMDGYETMRAIRQIPEFRSLPIIAADRESHEGRPRKMPRSGRFRLHHQAGGSGTAVLGAARVAGTEPEPPHDGCGVDG